MEGRERDRHGGRAVGSSVWKGPKTPVVSTLTSKQGWRRGSHPDAGIFFLSSAWAARPNLYNGSKVSEIAFLTRGFLLSHGTILLPAFPSDGSK